MIDVAGWITDRSARLRMIEEKVSEAVGETTTGQFRVEIGPPHGSGQYTNQKQIEAQK